MKYGVFLFILASYTLAASWSAGLGGGAVRYMGYPVDTFGVPRFSTVRTGYRIEAEVGYYTGKEGFDFLLAYAENLSQSESGLSFYRDQHLGLLAEYRLFVLEDSPYLQGGIGLGPSMHRYKIYTEEETITRTPFFALDAGLAGIAFASPHLILRLGLSYSFPPLRPRFGVLSLTFRAAYRS